MSFGFFSGFYEVRLTELQIDPQLESTIRPKARGLHSIWNAILQIAFSIWFLHQDNTSTIEDLREKNSGTLGTTRDDFKSTHGSAGVPSSLGMIQVLLGTFSLWNSGTLKDYSPRPSRLLKNILHDYKVLAGLSYGHPWTHYSAGYQDRLLGGPLGLLDLCYTIPVAVELKDYRGIVLS
jgi:hypothetical protein